MIGIVAVSHSARLGDAALELATQMMPGDAVPVRVAAGAGVDDSGMPVLGTDATAVAQAIDELSERSEGVLILMDLGSAVLSAELALELRLSDVPVRLVAAPFVEGLLGAVVAAGAGGSLDAVAEEALRALDAKTAQLQPAEEAVAAGEASDVSGAAQRRVVRVRNALGLHARPAALLAEAAAGADVRLRRLPAGPDASAASLSRLLALGVRAGDEVELIAEGENAVGVLDRLSALFDDGFGEGSVASAPADDSPERGGDPSDGEDGSVLHGRGVSAGRAAGPIVHLRARSVEPAAGEAVLADSRAAEAARIGDAAGTVAEEFRRQARDADGETRDILEAAALMAADPELQDDAAQRVTSDGVSAARAVYEASASSIHALEALGGRAAERATDVRDVRDRMIALLQGAAGDDWRHDAAASMRVPRGDAPFVLVAEDLAPADTAALGGSGCVALITERGGPTSHTAIIARALGLPAVVAVPGATRVPEGRMALVDGGSGRIEIDPTPERLALAVVADGPAEFDGGGRLADGLRVPLRANVGSGVEARAAAEARAEGIGLFRTEFCFLNRSDAPEVAEQVRAYREVLAPFSGRTVVVRTLDAGSDKPLPFVSSQTEENPALGVRGLRISRRAPQLLVTQLEALALAAQAESAHVEVMAPMVSTIEETEAFVAQARAAGLDRVGVMIETPAAAIMADEILRVADFVSIGTNDLTQYTLAADRQLGELGELNDPWQPAVLRLIGRIGEAGRRTGRDVGVCGEAGGDPALAPVLVGLGATSLSMTPRALGPVAQTLRSVSTEQCRRAAAAVLHADTAEQARALAAAELVSADADPPVPPH
ncbi:phosphoenolpyruvate--protein phosphotransferase [Microbacterium sp. USHLN186]|uniref:phosphoenolpyruvate--protein phosphotransferase n=1 Tax=Microbacterium sp. USHLN186 TaxID=3081286 RepID=UPI003016E2F1